MKTLRQRYPFSAIVGQEELKQALLLNLIYPGIGGVLIRGEKGTAKSTAVRALEAILPEIDVVDGCPCGCDPHGDALCPWCLEQEALESVSRQVRVVDLPVGSTEDRVVGSLDMETALREGRRRFRTGESLRMPTGVSCMWTKSTCWMTILWTYCWMRRQWA